MENSSVWQLFSKLGHIERKHLGLWLQSPLFNKRERPLHLHTYFQECVMKKQLPHEDTAFKKVFADKNEAIGQRKKTGPGSDEKSDQQSLRLVMSELLGQTEHFLAYKECFDSEINYHIRVAAAYRKRGLEKPFFQNINAAKNAWERQPYRHTEYHDALAGIEYEQYQLLSTGQRTIPLNLQRISDQTDMAYLARKLREACFALTHQAVFKTTYQLGLLDAVTDHLSRNPELLELPAISLYYYCYHFLKDPENENYFQQFKNALLTQMQQLPLDEQRNLHLLALNYCIKKINQRNTIYIRETFELYQSALMGDLLLENGLLSHFAFNNIVAAAIMAGETDWAEQFIHQNIGLLEKKYQEATSCLNLARVAYVRRDLGKSLLYLQQADYKDLINNLIAKTLQMKIYYETSELDVLDAHLENMRSFIRRQRIFGYHKTIFLNIVHYARKLARLNRNSKADREALRLRIENEPDLGERDWFLEQVR